MSVLDAPSRRICLVLQSGIGDVVHGLPLVNALKQDDPAREITWIVERTPAPLLQHHPSVDAVIHFDRGGGLPEVRALWRALRSRSFDLVLNCGIYFKSIFPTLFARAPHKLGFGRDRADDLVWLFANHRLPPQPPRHRQDMYLELLEPLGLACAELEWRITFSAEERKAQSQFFAALDGERFAAIVASASSRVKDWPVERFAELATALERDFDFRVLLLGGPGEREGQRAREVVERSEARAVWAQGPELRRLVYLLDGCELLIAPDTGPLHIARALETPVIGLYGHTDPRRSGPYRKYQDLTIDRYNYDGPGVPYRGPVERQHRARPGARHGRMELISVADVLEKVELAVERYLMPEGSAS
ncbi:MAG: glycosyltransferase family 9 protein [Gemmatimonadota bacterium]|nr:MAG: glycosyltransferase family 9 protein [Gemmatimonadota bacterium]